MHKVMVKRNINKPIADVWRVLDDFGAVASYHPAVANSYLVAGSNRGFGAERICEFHDGSRLKEKIIHYAHEKGFSLELSEFSMPLRSAISHFEIERLGLARSVVTVTMEFIPKFGLLGWLLAKLVMKPMMRKALNGLLSGLDTYLQEGQKSRHKMQEK